METNINVDKIVTYWTESADRDFSTIKELYTWIKHRQLK